MTMDDKNPELAANQRPGEGIGDVADWTTAARASWAWRRFNPLAGSPSDVHATVEQVERDAEKFLARVRLGVVVLFGAVLAVLTLVFDYTSVEVLLLYSAYLALSVVALARGAAGRFASWLPWVVTTLDVVLVLSVVSLGSRASMLPGAYFASVTTTWAAFLLLALATLRYDGWLVIYETTLFVAGFSMVIVFGDEPDGVLGPAEVLPYFFEPGRNVVRIALLAATGLILALAVFRARMSLARAVASARERGNLARHFATPVADLLASQGMAALSGRQQPAAVLFADIRGFTTVSETLAPPELARFITEFRQRATRATQRHAGIVDKFIGDAVMAVFGVPEPTPADALNALRAAMALLAEMADWNHDRCAAGLTPVHLGVGVHYGVVFAGALGDDERLEFTVLGDAVNVAQRIEELTRSLGTDLIVSEDLLKAADLPDRRERDWGLRTLNSQTLRGRTKPIVLFGLAAH
jgi:adenylate cyclase